MTAPIVGLCVYFKHDKECRYLGTIRTEMIPQRGESIALIDKNILHPDPAVEERINSGEPLFVEHVHTAYGKTDSVSMTVSLYHREPLFGR